MRFVSAGFFALVVGCSGKADEAPTWDDVAPIFEESCTTCHQEGGIGTFAMETYKGTTPYAAQIKQEVADRTMPPWLVTDDGSCQEYEASTTLTDEEIQTISDWVDAGVPEGTQYAKLVPAPPPSLDRRDISFQTPLFEPIPEGILFAEKDEYRCFAWVNPTEEDVFITGFEVEPGNEAIVHHVIGMPVDPYGLSGTGETTNGEEIATLDGSDGRLGWGCKVGAGGKVKERGMPVTWAPGQGGVEFPEGSGFRLEADDIIVFQVHYNLADPRNLGGSDTSEIFLRIEDQVESEAYMAMPDPFLDSMGAFPNSESLPPGEEATTFTWEMSVPELLDTAWLYDHDGIETVTVHSVAPHMHELGTELELTFIREAGDEECGAEVLAWDFNWQFLYFYTTPVTLTMADRVRVKCTYDTSDVDLPTLPGWSTKNEMCLAGMYVTTN